DASHELRTPAHVTRTAAEVTLSGRGRTEAEYREALSIVAEQTRRMSRLIDDMLLLARADMGQRPIEPSSFYLDELVGEAVRALRVLAAPRRVSIAVDAAPDLEITADEALVRQLVTNVVGNAIRHSPAGGTVTVRVARAAGQATIDVIDQGPGVPEAERARIFERFVKRDPSREHGEGAGLGLPIARWIAEAHGGTLVLAETGAAGATFRATLPLTAPGAASPRPNAA
ncbi:MAG TPA: HAMP domain-containing sensor histidine kinase, partial [Burkholderiales bacterium]